MSKTKQLDNARVSMAKKGQRIDPNLKTKILKEAEEIGPKAAALAHNLHEQTIYRWRQMEKAKAAITPTKVSQKSNLSSVRVYEEMKTKILIEYLEHELSKLKK